MNRDALKLLANNKPKKNKKNKYGAKKITVDGVTYDSQGEYRRECELRLQEKAKIITNLKRQVRFSFNVNDVHVCDYIADWTYTIIKSNTAVVEDFKGVESDTFKIKKKLMKACHGIDVWVNKNVNAHCEIEYPYY